METYRPQRQVGEDLHDTSLINEGRLLTDLRLVILLSAHLSDPGHTTDKMSSVKLASYG